MKPSWWVTLVFVALGCAAPGDPSTARRVEPRESGEDASAAGASPEASPEAHAPGGSGGAASEADPVDSMPPTGGAVGAPAAGQQPAVPLRDAGMELADAAADEPSLMVPAPDASADAGVAPVPEASDAGAPGTDPLAPCEDYACDAEVVRSILTLNGYPDVEVSYVDRTPDDEDRITSLSFTTNEFVDPWLILDVLPKEIGRLSALGELVVADGTFTELPEELADLETLEALYVYRCPLSGFPDVVLRIPSLSELGLLDVGLTEIPEGIATLPNLRILSLGGNSIEALPDAITISASLEALELSSNLIAALPEDIGALTNLDVLTLAGNNLTELPDGIVQLAPTTALFRNNSLCEVPVVIADWLDQYATPPWDDEQWLDLETRETRCEVVRTP